MIDKILQIKKRCAFAEEIGHAHDLTMGEVECVFAIASHEELTSKTLSSILALSPSRGSRIVNKLVERELIKAQVDSHDRRTVLLSLTDTGRQYHRELEEEKNRCAQRLFEKLNEDQKRMVEQGLDILLHVM